MDENNSTDCLNYQPNLCRCCLSGNGLWDISASYISESGDKEVYSDMIADCYGISLLVDETKSHVICELCVGQLRDANNFKKQIIEAEAKFNKCYEDWRQNIKAEICEELLAETDYSLDDHKSDINDNEDDKRTKKYKKKKNKTKNGSDTDSADKAITKKKPVSMAQRISQTCNTILRDTTACPFRHRKSWFQCFFCTDSFVKMTLLRSHTLETHIDMDDEIKKVKKRFPRSLQIDISNFECRYCNLALTDVELMRRHFLETHNRIIYKECIADYKIDMSPYTCHICGKEFHVFRTLTTHLNEHYAYWICDVCGKSYMNSKRLKVHSQTHEDGEYPCPECDKVLKTKTAKSNHMESAHLKRVLKCQICFEPMKHYNDRIKHMSEVHNITHMFKCPICSKEYKIKHYLTTHIRQTHGNKNKACTECGMAFITNHALKKHLLKHSGVKSFKCDVCNKSYTRSYTLKEHMRVHSTNQIYNIN